MVRSCVCVAVTCWYDLERPRTDLSYRSAVRYRISEKATHPRKVAFFLPWACIPTSLASIAISRVPRAFDLTPPASCTLGRISLVILPLAKGLLSTYRNCYTASSLTACRQMVVRLLNRCVHWHAISVFLTKVMPVTTWRIMVAVRSMTIIESCASHISMS